MTPNEPTQRRPAKRLPGATYRLQFSKDFTFRQALEWVPYWKKLGITDIYASPFLTSRAGSVHGYDVVDPQTLNPEIGSEKELERLHDALESRGMGLIMDIVPNHMCVSTNDNIWWNDVLENGPSSPYAKFFDIDWKPPKAELQDKVLLPVLGDQYGKVLESAELRLIETGGAIWVTYGERRFPIGPGTYAVVLEGALRRLHLGQEEMGAAATELESLVTASRRLPGRSVTAPDEVRERRREKEVLKARLAELMRRSDVARRAVEDELGDMNGTKGVPRSFDRLEALLSEQAYRLSFWRVAAEHINYRRFFEINDLAAVRIEEPEVLEAVHEKAFELMKRGWVTGFRVDHIDGLLLPKRYLEEIARQTDSPYVVVEKILGPGEHLPEDWLASGTTGYEFLNMVGGLFVCAGGEKALRSFYDGWRLVRGDFADIAYDSKRVILDSSMASELSVLARRLDRISEQHRWSRDFTIGTLQQVLAATIACFPVYRTYIAEGDPTVSEDDAAHINTAIEAAKLRCGPINTSAFDFLGEVLLGQDPEGLSDSERKERRDFTLRFQELTGPVTAKGVEDTAFYRYFPLASINEVGGNPTRFGIPLSEFHGLMEERARSRPTALSATSTHDTKRAEDNRARLSAVSEIPEAWVSSVLEWRVIAAPWKAKVNGEPAPDKDDEYYIYQTLIGAWPVKGLEDESYPSFAARVQAAAQKAAREAKRNTSWIHPNEPYEEATRAFVGRILDPRGELAPKLSEFAARITLPGLLTSLAQLVVKATAPGVPDFFQGTELWDFSMVDPDNRRRIDFGKRSQILTEALERRDEGRLDFIRELWRTPEDGRIKVFLTHALLACRAKNSALFERGSYVGLACHGAKQENVIAFLRSFEGRASITLTGRFFAQWAKSEGKEASTQAWGDTSIELPDDWRFSAVEDNLRGVMIPLRNRTLRLAEVFAEMPYAVLVGGVTS